MKNEYDIFLRNYVFLEKSFSRNIFLLIYSPVIFYKCQEHSIVTKMQSSRMIFDKYFNCHQHTFNKINDIFFKTTVYEYQNNHAIHNYTA